MWVSLPGPWGRASEADGLSTTPGSRTVSSFPRHLVFDGLPAVTLLRQASSVVGPVRAGAVGSEAGTCRQCADRGLLLAKCDCDKSLSLLCLSFFLCRMGTRGRGMIPCVSGADPVVSSQRAVRVAVDEMPRGGVGWGTLRRGLPCPELHVLLRRPPGQTTRLCTGTCCGPAACTGSRRSRLPLWSGTK